jgi:hypothetical protein
MTEIDPCPLCGNKKDLIVLPDFSEDEPTRIYAYHVFCQHCHTHGRNCYPIGWCESEQAAIEAWNDRYDMGGNMNEIKYCPHCGTNSEKNTIRCTEEYNEFSIFTCYNCGKSHIREIKKELLSTIRTKNIEINPRKLKALKGIVGFMFSFVNLSEDLKEDLKTTDDFYHELKIIYQENK